MNTQTKMKIILSVLLVIALAMIAAIVFIVWNYTEKSKWTYEPIEDEGIADMEEAASMYGATYLYDPKEVALDFFDAEGYGQPVETKTLKSGAKYVFLMTNEDGLKMKAEVIQPGSKGQYGVWVVKRYIADPLPGEEEQEEAPADAA